MSVLGVELSDAGILIAGAEPDRLLKVDENRFESPGFALPEKKRLIVGAAAERKAQLYPRQILNQFWDHLDIEPLEQPNPFAQNHAEIAFEHLARIWETAKHHGNEMVFAVPSFYTREHLGLILGITQELGIRVKGFVPIAIAAVSEQPPSDGLVLHLDLHLHRCEVVCLEYAERLSQKDSISSEGNGLKHLYRRWVDAIAEEFVRSTRFDPLHQAATEQELYDRLPAILTQLYRNPSLHFEMTGGSKIYRLTLTRDLFYKKAAPVYEEMHRLVDRFCERYGKGETGPALMLTDRAARLPGLKELLAGIENSRVIELEPGAAALGILRLSRPLFEQQTGNNAPFLTSRPLPAGGTSIYEEPLTDPGHHQRPTHILYRNFAHPITEKPLIIGLQSFSNRTGIQIQGQIAGVSQKHCAVQLQGDQVVLNDYSNTGTFVDENPVKGRTMLLLGQTLRVGTPGETLKLIACLDREADEA